MRSARSVLRAVVLLACLGVAAMFRIAKTRDADLPVWAWVLAGVVLTATFYIAYLETKWSRKAQRDSDR